MRKLGLALLVVTCLGLGYALVRAQPVIMPPPPGTSATLCTFNTVLPTMNAGFPGFVQCDVNGRTITSPGSAGAAGYPNGSTPVTASASGTTAAVTATLPAIAARLLYICGFVDDAVATAATAVTGSITGMSGGTFTYVQQVGTLTGTGNYHYQITYTPCIPASAVNTQIQLVSGAAGVGGVQGVMLWGFYQ